MKEETITIKRPTTYKISDDSFMNIDISWPDNNLKLKGTSKLIKLFRDEDKKYLLVELEDGKVEAY